MRRISYDAYLKQLRGNTTESATDVSALGSLPATSPIGNGQVILPETLAANLGLGTQNPATHVAVAELRRPGNSGLRRFWLILFDRRR